MSRPIKSSPNSQNIINRFDKDKAVNTIIDLAIRQKPIPDVPVPYNQLFPSSITGNPADDTTPVAKHAQRLSALNDSPANVNNFTRIRAGEEKPAGRSWGVANLIPYSLHNFLLSPDNPSDVLYRDAMHNGIHEAGDLFPEQYRKNIIHYIHPTLSYPNSVVELFGNVPWENIHTTPSLNRDYRDINGYSHKHVTDIDPTKQSHEEVQHHAKIGAIRNLVQQGIQLLPDDTKGILRDIYGSDISPHEVSQHKYFREHSVELDKYHTPGKYPSLKPSYLNSLKNNVLGHLAGDLIANGYEKYLQEGETKPFHEWVTEDYVLPGKVNDFKNIVADGIWKTEHPARLLSDRTYD